MVDDVLTAARDDLSKLAGNYDYFELGGEILRMRPDDDAKSDEFLLVSVNTDIDECVRIYEEWLDAHPIVVASTDPMDDIPQVEVKEIRPEGDGRRW